MKSSSCQAPCDPPCEKAVIARGFCSAHYQCFMRHGDPLYRKPKKPPAECNIDGCQKDCVSKGLCANHYQQALYRTNPRHLRPGKPCAVEDCKNKARARGLCDKHYMRWLNHGDINHKRWTPPAICGLNECEESYYAKGRCKLHYSRERTQRKQSLRHGITEDRYLELLARQGGKCAICKTTEPGGRGRWCIDHDHGCCPTGDGSCGQCIRGILCASCNTGLGMFKDNPDALRAAIRYLGSSPKF